ncbi:MAG: hypothetical protein EI684_06750 [Candidatus Viridilinea halotolerans]|uniref:Aminoglycoside phosphotransferase family protein n=1 Tax=Candidatus Viridilinea halotolerans TaxID=2491704 RepID=A0A426U3W7_9CHLR|nr:MAG: hypothetical protein EI684_06750 [Candidatus Viridilinea halotolerans]
MPSTPPIAFESHVILMHAEHAACLLLPDTAGWRLPCLREAQRHVWQEVGHLQAWLQAELAAPAALLRCIDLAYRPADELVSKLYGAVLQTAAWPLPRGARWATRAELADLPLAHTVQRDLLAAWFAWYSSGPHAAQRPPWYQPGWYGQATAWAAAELTRLGWPPTGPAQQVRWWQRGALLRIPTAQGHTLLKAALPLLRHELELNAALAAHHPGCFAQPLALDAERGWLLSEELAGDTLDTRRAEEDLPHWEVALARFAEVQIASTQRHAALRTLGLPAYPVGSLTPRLAPLLADPAAALPDRPAGLAAAAWNDLVRLAAHVGPLSEALAAYDLPLVLEHGDFWAGQVVVGPQGCAFLDWSISVLSHPFFSLLLFLVEIEDFFPHEHGVRERLRDAYLEPWTAVAHGRNLTHAFELAQPLAALHHALTYHQVILPNIEIKWELELMLPFYLKMALRLIDDKIWRFY